MRGLICDDHPLMRDALRFTMLSRWPRAQLDLAGTYQEAWALAATAADFCLLDLAMPGADPRSGIARLREIAPALPILIVTALTDEALWRDVLALGATAILPKELDAEPMLDAVQSAIEARYPNRPEALSSRQTEVLRLIAQGYTNKQVALSLNISPSTAKIHVARIIEFFGAANRTDAVFRARHAGAL